MRASELFSSVVLVFRSHFKNDQFQIAHQRLLVDCHGLSLSQWAPIPWMWFMFGSAWGEQLHRRNPIATQYK